MLANLALFFAIVFPTLMFSAFALAHADAQKGAR